MAMVLPIIRDRTGARGSFTLLVILGPDNLARMQVGDPFDFQPAVLNLDIPHDSISELDLVVAYETDYELIERLAKEGGLPAVVAHIERGRVNLPGDGEKPVSMRAKVRPQ